LYEPAEFIKLQAALVAPADDYYPNRPYPPTFFLFFAPFTMVRNLYRFIAWDSLGRAAVTVILCGDEIWSDLLRSSAFPWHTGSGPRFILQNAIGIRRVRLLGSPSIFGYSV
jgi:hypothetical protein